jgi:hypothetical protein
MRWLVFTAAAGALALAAFLVWPTDARAIRQRLSAAADAVSVPAGEGDLQRVARAAGLRKSLAPDVVVEAGPDGPSVRGRDTLVALASRLGSPGPVTIVLADARLAIDGPAGRATAGVLVRVDGGDGHEVGGYDGAELRVELTKIDGTWLIARVTGIPALRR